MPRMQEVATIGTERAQPAPKRIASRRISPKIKKAVLLIESGECKTQKAAAVRAGISETYLSTQLKKPAVQAFIAQRARQTIAVGVTRASARVVELMDASSEHVSLDAAKHVLAIEGIKPADEPAIINNVNVLAGYMVDLGAHTQSGEIVSPPIESGEP